MRVFVASIIFALLFGAGMAALPLIPSPWGWWAECKTQEIKAQLQDNLDALDIHWAQQEKNIEEMRRYNQKLSKTLQGKRRQLELVEKATSPSSLTTSDPPR